MSNLPAIDASTVRTPLRPAVHGSRHQLSAKATQEILAMARPAPLRFTIQLLGAWCAMGAAVCLAEYAQEWYVTIIVIVFIATRQHILGLLVHEQCHGLGFGAHPLGTLLADLSAAYPLLGSVR